MIRKHLIMEISRFSVEFRRDETAAWTDILPQEPNGTLVAKRQ